MLSPTKTWLPLRVIRAIIRAISTTATVATCLYVALALTVVAVMSSGADRAVVVRGAFPGGIATVGDFAYVSAKPNDRSLMGKVEQAFIGVPGGSTVQTVALPGATLTTKTGQLLADKKPTGFYGVAPQKKLGHEYLVVCVSGSGCIPGALTVIPDTHIIGQVRTFVGVHGLSDPHNYRR